MLKKFLSTAVVLSFLSTNLYSQSSGFGIGIILGEPTGISLKSWASQSTAFDAGIAWGFDRGAFHVHADYLIHDYDIINVNSGKLPLYYGFGGRISFTGDTRIGVRGVVGLDYMFASVPVDIFLEIIPIFDIVPSTDFGFNAGLGARYFF